MEIVNKSLPRGSRFYPLDPVMKVPVEHLMRRSNIELLRNARKLVQESKANSEYWGICESTYSWHIEEGTDEYPVIEMPAYGLSRITYHFNSYIKHSKANYVNCARIGHINLAVPEDKIKVQYDPIRGGLIVHEVEYEGELDSNKPMVINKQLKSAVKTKIGELALEALIGAGDEDLTVSSEVCWGATKASRGELASKLIPKILSGDYDTSELATCAVALGLYNTKRVNHLPNRIIDMDSPNTEVDFEITAAARTKLIYYFGGYKLPENYQEWFNG